MILPAQLLYLRNSRYKELVYLQEPMRIVVIKIKFLKILMIFEKGKGEGSDEPAESLGLIFFVPLLSLSLFQLRAFMT